MMPSFRQKFVGFIRQLSNTSDSPRDSDVPDNVSECFIQNYLKGSDKVNKNEPVILHGKKPYEIPPLTIGEYATDEIKAAHTGPDGGLGSVNKKEEENGNNIIVGTDNWNNAHERSYGKSCSLYEVHPITELRAGDPIADCYGILVRENSAILALADGVNWGVKASIAAKAAVHGSIDYVNQHVFGMASPKPTTTTEVFISLLRSFHTAHSLILQEKGMLTTLTTAVVLPLADSQGKYVVCTCNVGDSLAYVYSPKHGVREITQGSHDVHQMRDMRDALGALGPVDGQNPELSNLTLSMTELEPGDIVFLTSDGVSDNLDPVVGKFTGLPTVEAHQRHKLVLLRTEDLLRYGVSGKGPSISSARDVVTLLLDFVSRLTAAKRHVLEDRDLYTGRDGKVLSPSEQVARRREVCKRLHAIPGKLDHATVVAYSVGQWGEGEVKGNYAWVEEDGEEGEDQGIEAEVDEKNLENLKKDEKEDGNNRILDGEENEQGENERVEDSKEEENGEIGTRLMEMKGNERNVKERQDKKELREDSREKERREREEKRMRNEGRDKEVKDKRSKENVNASNKTQGHSKETASKVDLKEELGNRKQRKEDNIRKGQEKRSESTKGGKNVDSQSGKGEKKESIKTESGESRNRSSSVSKRREERKTGGLKGKDERALMKGKEEKGKSEKGEEKEKGKREPG
uniref:PP2C-like domain-containing protein CG9801 n=2 Tax=Cacopsylla melanoneura TaxID=428564 RepID=A0A8D8RX07_9HEMI